MSEAKSVVRIVTVHGTGDTATSAEGEKWFQRGSAFTSALTERLSASGLTAEIVPFLWSGANSAVARAAAAAGLHRTISRLTHGGHGVHVIGHSHGGNVANDAACRMDWRRSKGARRIGSVTTVGTPFLRLHVGLVESVATVTASIIAALGIAGCLYALLDVEQRNINYLPFLFAILFAVPFYALALRRLVRARRPKRSSLRILAIRHPNDEAISFLQHVEKLEVEPFPRWSLTRASGAGASLIGMLVSIAVFPSYLEQSIETAGREAQSQFAAVALIVSFTAIMSATWFVAAYLATRFAALLVLEGLLRGFLNGKVGGILKGLALGRDGGLKVGETSPQSHYFGTTEVMLEGAIADRMSEASGEATRRLFDKYRSSLFSVGADASNAIIEMARDSMTWDSLIHTTYFDQQEVAGLIGDHILAAERA